jgi:phosphoribosylanthranilate isomerase
MPIWIKICGTTNVADADAAIAAGASAIGFIFAPSPRRIAPLDARNIVTVLPATVQRIGVFVNETPERIREVVDRAKLTAVQLHGDETPDYVRELFRGRQPQPAALERFPEKRQRGTRVFKVVRMDKDAEAKLREFVAVGDLVDGILLDSSSSLRGGSGIAFDWDATAALLRQFESAKPRFILAGGLRPANVAEAIRKLKPWGVDVASGVEKQPGIKDRKAVFDFVDRVREAEKAL